MAFGHQVGLFFQADRGDDDVSLREKVTQDRISSNDDGTQKVRGPAVNDKQYL